MRALSLLAFLFGVSFECLAQSNIYSFGDGSYRTLVRERDWTVGTSSMRFGLEQFHRSVYDKPASKMITDGRYTVVHCGPFDFTTSIRAWMAAVVGAIDLVALGLLVSVIIGRIAGRRT
jgi:hypothetical protein